MSRPPYAARVRPSRSSLRLGVAAVAAAWLAVVGASGSREPVRAQVDGAPSAAAAAAAPDGVQGAQALGATIVVNEVNQEVNNDGDCSLQEAIFAANFDANKAIDPNSLNGPKLTTGCTPGSGADTIVLPANGVLVTNGTLGSGAANGVVQDPFNPAGLTATPSITSTITIQGNGARFERTTTTNIRAFMVNKQVGMEVSHAEGDLTIQNLHIKGFKAQGGNGSDGGGGGLGAGGAIYVRTGRLTIENSTFEGNNATGGAGGAVSGIAGGGGGGGMSTSAIGGNDVAVGAGNAGGGGGGARGRGGNGANGGGGGGGTANNGIDGTAGVGGTGGFNCGGKGGDFPNTAGTAGFCSGGAGGGGAQGTGAGVNGGNGAAGSYGGGGGGGGASSQANGGSGGAGGFGGGGGGGGAGTSNGGNGGFGAGGGARGSTGGTSGTGGFFGIGGNGGSDGGGGGSGLGGAIFNDSGTVTVRNSTFAGNQAVSGPRGGTSGTSGVGLGGAIWSRNGTVELRHVTMSGNSATPAPGTGVSEGALGIWSDGGPTTLRLYNTIMANNGPSECSSFAANGGVTALGSGNLIMANAGGSAVCPGVAQTANPNLGPLQINAPGNTPTMAIQNTSAAFNNADAAQGLPTDQRGVPRPQGAGFDIGAFELEIVDLSITKTCYGRPPEGSPTQDADVVIAGHQWICDIAVTNPSGVPVGDLILDDTLPAGLRFVASTAAGEANALGGVLPACAPTPFYGPGVVSCTGIDVAPQSTTRFQMAFTVSPEFVAASPVGELPVTNQICIRPGAFVDPNPANNCDTETDFVKELADLRITKFIESAHDPIRAGEVFTYTIFVDNLGPSVARNVTITDTFLSASNVQVASCAFSVSQGGGAISQFTCTTGNLVSTQFGTDIGTFSTNRLDPLSVITGPPPSGGHQGRLRASFRLVARGDLQTTNTARVASLTPDPDASNNFATVDRRVSAVADLQAFAVFGAEVQVNGQPGNIFNSNGVTPLPDLTCCNFGGTTVTAGRRLNWQMTVLNGGPSNAENVQSVVFLPYGTTLIENTLTTQVSPPPPFAVGRCRTEPAGALRNKVICEYGTLRVGQSGSVQMQMLVDPALPVGTQLSVDALTFSDSTEEAAPVVQQQTFEVVAAPAGAAQAVTQPGTFDPNLANNLTGIQFDTNAFADLSITKSAVGDVVNGYNATLQTHTKTQSATQVTPGELLEYLLTVTHKGPSLARGVHIRDDLPGSAGPVAQVAFVRATDVDGRPLTCVASGVNRDIVDCDLGDLLPGAVRRVRILVRVDASVPNATVLTNSAVVSSLTAEPFAADNTATNNMTAVAVADVYVTKTDVPAEARLDAAFEPDRAVAGREHRYVIEVGNLGPSTATGVGLTDSLDLKQPGRLGERFTRCEPFDLDDLVTCTFTAPNTVTLTRLQVGNEAIFPAASAGTILPGAGYRFYLITTVDEGYVLDGTDLLATNTATVAPGIADFRFQNNTDRHDTLIIAEADLVLTKADDAAGFLTCDPVAREGTITYDLTVTNRGPSDAADVYVVDQLPVDFVVADPAVVEVTVSRGEVVEVRDDGRITVRVGNDVNNNGVAELGRVNANSAPVTIRITVTVRKDAACGQQATNRAWVETRRNDAAWPIAPQPVAGVDGGPRTPTADPDAANNVAVAQTTIECPRIQVIKTVSFDGKCPGVNINAGVFNKTGQPITFCFEVTNTGTTFLDDIELSDVLDTRTMEPTVIYTATITSGADPNTPLKPGETVRRQVTVDQALLKWDCGRIVDTVTVTANPVNSGRTDLACLPLVTDDDTATIDVPCAGVDWRLQLPVVGGEGCETLIQVQNVGELDTKAVLIVWGEPSFCPPQAAGPLKVECSGLLRPGSAWTFTGAQLPAAARSAVVYSVNANNRVPNPQGNLRPFADVVCAMAQSYLVGSWEQWTAFDDAYKLQEKYFSPFDASGLHQYVLDFKANQGEPLAVTVNRACADAADPNVKAHAAYTGISSDQEGARDPRGGAYMYYAPLVFAAKGGLNTTLCIQNSGNECTSLELWFKGQDDCLRAVIGDVLSLSPGETVCFDPNNVIGPDWLGSAWIRSTQPLGMIIDTKGANHFTSYNGVAADVDALNFSYGNQVSFLPLTYSEYQGWDSAIQVQNLSPVVAAKVKVYFLDRGGDIVTTLVDWICPRGSQTYFLPVIANLPGMWAGSARAESQEWLTPGGPNVLAPPIAAVMLMERWSDPARTSRREAIAYNGQSECLLYDWQLGSGTGGTASGAAVLAMPLLAKYNRGIKSEFAVTNLVPKPGFTDFVVFMYDQNGLIDQICQKVSEKQVDYIDLDGYANINRGFLGSAVISAVFWEHDVFDERGQFVRNVVGLGATAIERIGSTSGAVDAPGDESKGYEAFPVFDFFYPEDPLSCPGVPDGFGGR